MHHYHLYGCVIASAFPLPYNPISRAAADITFVVADASAFDSVRGRRDSSTSAGWFHSESLRDDSYYLRWTNLAEFLISPAGDVVHCRALRDGVEEAFHSYLLSQVLSFALLKQGIEPLHATAVVIDGVAIAFLGDCGYGKSSLAASFLRDGASLLTDDLLILQRSAGGYAGWPGPPRLKLFPDVARDLLGPAAPVGTRNAFTAKALFPMAAQARSGPVPMAALYVLDRPQVFPNHGVRIDALAPKPAFLELTRNTFNSVLQGSDRLRTHMTLIADVANRVPVRLISYRRELALLPAVRAAILQDLAGFTSRSGAAHAKIGAL